MTKHITPRKWIKNATYEQLLHKNRFGPLGDEMFQGKLGKYFCKMMTKKRKELHPIEQVQASKNVGWG